MIRRASIAFFLAFVAAALGGCASSGAPSRSPVALRVMTWNIHHGEGTDGVIDLARIASVIRAQEPDLVALQEVDRGTHRSGGADQAAEIARLTGMRHVFARAMNYNGGEYGEAVLSRLPIDMLAAYELPHSEEREPRTVAWIMVPLRGRPRALLFQGTHLDHVADDRDRLDQARAINSISARIGMVEAEYPTILAGDLNADPASGVMRVLFDDGWVDAAQASDASAGGTWPSDEPQERIDYILLRPSSRWRVIEYRVIDEAVASDHRPVVADLEVR